MYGLAVCLDLRLDLGGHAYPVFDLAHDLDRLFSECEGENLRGVSKSFLLSLV